MGGGIVDAIEGSIPFHSKLHTGPHLSICCDELVTVQLCSYVRALHFKKLHSYHFQLRDTILVNVAPVLVLFLLS